MDFKKGKKLEARYLLVEYFNSQWWLIWSLVAKQLL
jgi:hypothetical protein